MFRSPVPHPFLRTPQKNEGVRVCGLEILGVGLETLGMLNQDYAIARFREDAGRGDPERWAVRTYEGRKQVWMALMGQEGWFQPWTEGGKVVYLQDESLGYSNLHRFLSGKMERKILEVVGEQTWQAKVN